MPDGSEVAYCDADPSHVRQGRWAAMADAVALRLTTSDGSQFAVILTSGKLYAGPTEYAPPVPTGAKLRPVYYRHREWDTGSQRIDDVYLVLGWQTTVAGKNHRLGFKVWLGDSRYEVTEDI